MSRATSWVVGVAFVLAAARPSPPGRLAQVAPRREREEGHDERARQRHHVRALSQAAIAGRLARGCADERRQAVELVVGQLQLEAGLVGQHVLREARGELGQALHDLRVARLLVGAQAGAGAHEVDVQALHQAQRLRNEPQRVARLMHGVEPREQPGVHHHRAVVRGQRAGQVALHGLDLGRRVRRGQRLERAFDARQQPAAAVERGHRVVEVRRLVQRRDGLHLGALRLHRGLERRREVGGPDLGERGHGKRRRPVGEQGVGSSHGGWRGILFERWRGGKWPRRGDSGKDTSPGHLPIPREVISDRGFTYEAFLPCGRCAACENGPSPDRPTRLRGHSLPTPLR